VRAGEQGGARIWTMMESAALRAGGRSWRLRIWGWLRVRSAAQRRPRLRS